MSQICNLCKDTSIVKRHSQMAFSKQKCQRWCICVLWRWCVCPRDTFHGQPCLSYRWQSVARVWQGVNEAWASFADDKYYKNAGQNYTKVVNPKRCHWYPKSCKEWAYETKYRSFDFALTDEDMKKDTKKSTIQDP